MVQVPSVNLGGHQKCPYEESPTIEKYLNIRPNLTLPNLTLSIQSYFVYTLCLWQAVRTTLGPIFEFRAFLDRTFLVRSFLVVPQNFCQLTLKVSNETLLHCCNIFQLLLS